MVKFPGLEFDGNVRVMLCDPADMVNGEEGDSVAPVGSPVMLIDAAPVNPFIAVTETWASREPPGGTVADVGDTERAKSGAGGGGLEPDPPPPQLDKKATRTPAASRRVTRLTDHLSEPARYCNT